MKRHRYKIADTEWMAGNFGVSVHWTSKSTPLTGPETDYETAVNDFNVPKFVKTLKSIHAKHLIFVTTHAEHKLPMPHPILDMLQPGLTTGRDLIGELADALEKADIDLILYYNHCCNGKNFEWKERIGYTSGDLDLFAARICLIVEYIARRYGRKIKGWWFDSGYALDNSNPTHQWVSTDMDGWRFPWEALNEAAKTGNPNAAVCFNSGCNQNVLYSYHQDYSAGEIYDLNVPEAGPYERFLTDRLRVHRWVPIDTREWVHNRKDTPFTSPRFSNEELERFINKFLKRKAMVTLNLEIDQKGVLNPASIKQLKQLNIPEGTIPCD